MSTPRVVVGVDGSDQSILAVHWAVQVATGLGAQVEAVGAWQYPSSYGIGAPLPGEWDPEKDTEQVLSDTLNKALDGKLPADLIQTVQEGNPAAVLLDRSKGAAMLVVGSRGHGGFAGLLLGSVSANVAERAGCPVLVVHGDEAPQVAKPTA